MVRLLLAHGAELDIENENGDTGLSLALWCRHEATALLLIEAGANINHVDSDSSQAPLEQALHLEMPHVFEVLLDRGAEFALASEGFLHNALVFVARWGEERLIRKLLERGASVTFQGKWSRTALDEATKYGHPHVAKILIEAGAQPAWDETRGILE